MHNATAVRRRPSAWATTSTGPCTTPGRTCATGGAATTHTMYVFCTDCLSQSPGQLLPVLSDVLSRGYCTACEAPPVPGPYLSGLTCAACTAAQPVLQECYKRYAAAAGVVGASLADRRAAFEQIWWVQPGDLMPHVGAREELVPCAEATACCWAGLPPELGPSCCVFFRPPLPASPSVTSTSPLPVSP